MKVRLQPVNASLEAIVILLFQFLTLREELEEHFRAAAIQFEIAEPVDAEPVDFENVDAPVAGDGPAQLSRARTDRWVRGRILALRAGELRRRAGEADEADGAGMVAPQELGDRIRWRMAPMTSAQVAVTAEFRADEAPPQRLVDMCGLTFQPERITGLDMDGLPPVVQMLVVARPGLVAPAHLARLRERGEVDHVSVKVVRRFPPEIPRVIPGEEGCPAC